MSHDFLDIFYGNDEATNFGAMLFRLIAKADPMNLAAIERGFPKHVSLYRWWMQTPTPPNPDVVKAMANSIEKGAQS